MMFNGAQEGITFSEQAEVIHRQQVVFDQAPQGLQGVAVANFGLLPAKRQLQILDHKFDIADGPLTQFDFAPAASFHP